MKKNPFEIFIAFIIIALAFIFFYSVLSNTFTELDLINIFKQGGIR